MFLTFKQILTKISGSLQRITLYRCIISDDQICELLSVIPNIEEFSIISSRIKRTNKSNLNLSKTRITKFDLSGSFCSTKLNTREYDLFNELIKMIAKNSPLNSMSIFEELLGVFPFKTTPLSHLRIENINPRHIRIGDTVGLQDKLTSLDLLSCFIMDDVLDSIRRNLKNLKVLKINVSGVSAMAFASLSTMKLEEFYVNAGKAKWIVSAIASSNFESVVNFHFNAAELFISVESYRVMLNALPNLKTLYVKTCTVPIIESIFKKKSNMRSSLISCTIEFAYIHLLKHMPKLDPKLDDICGLQDLSIINCDERFARKADFSFLRYFTNLKKLKINGFKVDTKLHKFALENHRELEYLELCEVKEKNILYVFNNDLSSCIQDFGKNLKVMKIDCINYALLPEYTKKQFPIVSRRGFMQVLRHR